MFPRSGPGTESWRKAESVWCASDRRDALTRAKRGEEVKSKACKAEEAIQAQYSMARTWASRAHRPSSRRPAITSAAS